MKLKPILVAVAVAVTLSGCTPAATVVPEKQPLPHDGPLILEHHGSACLPYPKFDHVALGTMMDVPEGTDIRIISVEPLNAVNADIGSESVMFSSRENRLYGYSWPLNKKYGKPWAEAIPAVGAVLPAGSTSDLVTEITPTKPGETVHVPSMRIVYEVDGGKRYRADSSYQMVMSTKDCADSDQITG